MKRLQEGYAPTVGSTHGQTAQGIMPEGRENKKRARCNMTNQIFPEHVTGTWQSVGWLVVSPGLFLGIGPSYAKCQILYYPDFQDAYLVCLHYHTHAPLWPGISIICNFPGPRIGNASSESKIDEGVKKTRVHHQCRSPEVTAVGSLSLSASSPLPDRTSFFSSCPVSTRLSGLAIRCNVTCRDVCFLLLRSCPRDLCVLRLETMSSQGVFVLTNSSRLASETAVQFPFISGTRRRIQGRLGAWPGGVAVDRAGLDLNSSSGLVSFAKRHYVEKQIKAVK